MRTMYEPGSRVIVRDNADGNYMTGVVVRHEDFGGKCRPALHVVKCNGEEYFVAGIVIKDSNELRATLDKLSPKEQWNYCRNLIFK